MTDLPYKGLPRACSASMELPIPKVLVWSLEFYELCLVDLFPDLDEREYTSLPIASDQVCKEGSKFIAGKIYALLADESVEMEVCDSVLAFLPQVYDLDVGSSLALRFCTTEQGKLCGPGHFNWLRVSEV